MILFYLLCFILHFGDLGLDLTTFEMRGASSCEDNLHVLSVSSEMPMPHREATWSGEWIGAFLSEPLTVQVADTVHANDDYNTQPGTWLYMMPLLTNGNSGVPSIGSGGGVGDHWKGQELFAQPEPMR